MFPEIVAMMLHTFFQLPQLEMWILQDKLTRSMLHLGAKWWEQNLGLVMSELKMRYDDPAAAAAAEGFVKFYSRLF